MNPTENKTDCSMMGVKKADSLLESRTRTNGAAGQSAGVNISQELINEAVQTLASALKAESVKWDGAAKVMVTNPDFQVRLRAAELLLNYGIGKPIERSVKLTGDFSSYSDRLTALCASPEGLRTAVMLGLVDPQQAKNGRGTSEKPLIETVSDEKKL